MRAFFIRLGQEDRKVKRKMLIVTTSPMTLLTILKGQPRYLDKEFDVYLCTDGSVSEDLLVISQYEGVEVTPVQMKRGISPVNDVRSIWQMLKVMQELNPQIVHSYTPKAGLIAMCASFLGRVPMRVHTFTGLVFPSRSGVMRFLLKNIDRLICLLSTHIVSESEGVKSELIENRITTKPLHKIGEGNIAGVDLDYFDPDLEQLQASARALRRKWNKYNQERVFCFVGRLNADKGIDELNIASESLCDDSMVVIVGGLDESNPIAIDLYDKISRDSRFELAGFQQDIRPYLLASDALVLPSYREGFPNVVLQALAMQRPVITTEVHGATEVIVEGENGWLVPIKDASGLSKAMKLAEAAPADELRRMGESGRKTIKSKYERSRYLAQLSLFYRVGG